MISYSNIREYKDLPFERYIALKGFSHSFLKMETNGVKPELVVSDKMRLGTLVDAFLTQPEAVDFNDPQFMRGRKIAMRIQERFGDLIKHFEPQISYSAIMEFKGLSMPVCGRLDWLLRGHADIDLKVTGAKTDRQFRQLINVMGYDNQQWHYARMAGVKKAYILPYSTEANECLDIVEVPVDETNDFWEEKILKFGNVA